jgi:predicted P-loop ATPase
MKKGQQDDLKDVGGFVAGTFAGERRKASSVTGRDVLTLDLDNIPAGGTQDVLRRVEGLGCGYCIYSTRKHHEAAPRLRVLLPLDRTVTADEYEPIARKTASWIGIELCDKTTFEPSRLMYWPSCSADSTFIHVFGDKPFLYADGVLAQYVDWRNTLEWAQVPGVQEDFTRLLKKQEDPTSKAGVVGAFCRTYDIYRAMDELIPGEYSPTDIPGRYTYAGGSTTGGAVLYDNGLFLFSHHATDPCSGKLVNAFDLVRLHKYGFKDDDAKPETPANKMPSYIAMCDFALQDKIVAALIHQERRDQALEAFDSPIENAEADDLNWMSKLAISTTSGQILKTVDNVLIILDNDPLLKNKLAFDEFANRGLALGALPWDNRGVRRQWVDTDDVGLRHYIEKLYGITGKDRLYDATALCAFRHRINDVQDYLKTLRWDGVPRLDTLLTDYLGAADNAYTRAVIRKSLAAAVARAMTPGCKYDYMPILAGPQGIGKSTFLRFLGLRWYSDSLQTFEGKEASEMIQGTWLNELGELNGLTRSENNAVKQFLSRTEDIFREPYGRRTAGYPRRCVFFGTTNDSEFLRDRTGNRRFWPVDVGLHNTTKSVFKDLEAEVPQIWAEAFVAWQLGEPLYLSGTAEAISKDEQEAHKESNAKEGFILEFLAKPVPLDWYNRSVQQRRNYWQSEFERQGQQTQERDRICAAEIWCECFCKDISAMRRLDALEINSILEGLQGWKKHSSSQRFGGEYGTIKGFIKT